MKNGYHMRNVDIAQVLNIDSNKVNGRIFRAKQKLKEILGTEAYERITRQQDGCFDQCILVPKCLERSRDIYEFGCERDQR